MSDNFALVMTNNETHLPILTIDYEGHIVHKGVSVPATEELYKALIDSFTEFAAIVGVPLTKQVSDV